MRVLGITARTFTLLFLAVVSVPSFASFVYVPVSPTVVAQTEDHYRLRGKVSEAPFGNFRTTSHPGGDCGNPDNALTCAAPYTFTGHLYDQESGLYYFGARYYDPETGRFLSQDPVAGDALNPPSLHKYLYAYSSPMNYTDPWGERVFDENDKPVWMEQRDIENLNPGQVDTIRNIRNAVKVGYGQHGKYHRLLTEGIQEAAKKFNMAALFDGDPSQKEYLRIMVGAYQTAFGKEAEQDVRGYTVNRGPIEAAPITWEERAEAMRGATAGMGEFVYSNTPLSAPEKIVEGYGEFNRRAHQVATLGWGKAWEEWTVEDKAQRDATIKGVDDFVNLRTAERAWQTATSGNYEAGQAWGGAVIGGEFAALGVGTSGIGTMRGAPGGVVSAFDEQVAPALAQCRTALPGYSDVAPQPQLSIEVPEPAPSKWQVTEYKGTRVYTRDDLFDPNQMTSWRAHGKVVSGTNLERMATGRAPIGYDGQSVVLHHTIQMPNGPLAEVAASFHQKYFSTLHINTGDLPSGINRGVAGTWREDYWINRASQFK